MSDYEEKLDAICRRIIDDAVHHRPEDIPDVVYHYTDAAGLYGTLSSNVIWATESRFLNDREELRHLISNAIDHVQKTALASDIDLKKRLYTEIIEEFKRPYKSLYFIYSLSSKRDDLSQWRGYSRDGQGFTLGFSGREVYDYSRQDVAPYAFAKMEYDHERQDFLIKYALSEVEKYIDSEIEKKDCDVDLLIRRAVVNYCWAIENRSSLSKHRSFIEESEWRVVTTSPDGKMASGVKVRVGGSRLVPYVEIPLPSNKKLPLKSIGIGPSLNADEQKIAIFHLCQQFGYNPEIYVADSPYRRI